MSKHKCSHKQNYKLTELPDDVFSGKLLKFADEYKNSAHALSKNTDKPPVPYYFLLSHSIELYLKAFLSAKSTKLRRMRDLDHCLSCLYSEAKTYGINCSEVKIEDHLWHIKEYTELFRFPDFEIKEAISVNDLEHTLTVIEDAVRSEVLLKVINGFEPGRKYDANIFRHTNKED